MAHEIFDILSSSDSNSVTVFCQKLQTLTDFNIINDEGVSLLQATINRGRNRSPNEDSRNEDYRLSALLSHDIDLYVNRDNIYYYINSGLVLKNGNIFDFIQDLEKYDLLNVISKKEEIVIPDRNQWFLLNAILAKNRYDIAKMLLNLKLISLHNQIDYTRNTYLFMPPLHNAICLENNEAFNFLGQYIVNHEIVDRFNRTAIKVAVYFGRIKYVKALLSMGAPIPEKVDYLKDNVALYNRTFFEWCFSLPDINLILFCLKENKITLDLNQILKILLHWVTDSSVNELHRYVLNKYAKNKEVLNSLLESGKTLVHVAVQYKFIFKLDVLFKLGADLDVCDYLGQNAFQFALALNETCGSSYHEVQKYLASEIISSNSSNKIKELSMFTFRLSKQPIFIEGTVIDWAMEYGHADLLQYYITKTSDVKYSSYSGNGEYLLHWAARMNNIELLLQIMQHGVSPYYKNREGKNIFDLISKPEIVQRLKEKADNISHAVIGYPLEFLYNFEKIQQLSLFVDINDIWKKFSTLVKEDGMTFILYPMLQCLASLCYKNQEEHLKAVQSVGQVNLRDVGLFSKEMGLVLTQYKMELMQSLASQPAEPVFSSPSKVTPA